jgi:dTMP kinase
MKGKLFVVDAIDGAGKSSVINHLAHLLLSYGVNVKVTREPGGTPMAEEIRNVLIANRDEPVNDVTEALLMFASRCQHYHNLIKPSVEQGVFVVSSRFTTSSYAYQHYSRGLDIQIIRDLEKMVLGDFRPDMTFILDVSPEVSMQRAIERNELDRIEQSGMEFFHKARAGYLAQAAENPERFIVIDANQSLKDVLSDISKEVSILMGKGL